MSGLWGRLKLKVLAFGIVMSVLPLALFGWYGLVAARSAQVEIVQTENRAAARMVAEDLARFSAELTTPVALLARVVGAGLPQADPAERERLLHALLRDVPHLEEVAVVDRNGQELSRVSRRELTTGADLPSHAGTPLWRDLAHGRPTLGAVTLDSDGRPLMQVGVPLTDGGGAIIGRASLRSLVANIAAVRGSGSVRLHVLDESGRVIGDSDFSLVLAGSHAQLPPGDTVPYRSVTGEQALGASATVPGLPWQVVGETTLDRAMGPVVRLGLEFVGGALVLMALVIALSVVFGLQLTEPLERLEAGARRVGAGDLAHRVPEGGRDELGRLVTAFNAMTERIEAQSSALQAERDRLDTVVSAIGAGLVLVDASGTIQWANQTLRQWFPGPLVGRACREVLAWNAADGRPGGHPEGAERQIMVGGRPRLIRQTAYALGVAHPGAHPGAPEPVRLEVLEDVTERRAMEAMVRQSEKLAAVGQLAAGVAHEINNPLAVISAYAEDLGDRLREEGAAALDGDGTLGGYLEQLQVQVQRCKGITTNLLDFARSGATALEPVDPVAVARQTMQLVSPRARRSGVSLRVAPEGDVPPVRATRDQLQQVFLNLIANALDAVEAMAGTPEIVVTAAAGPGIVRLSVADNGPGMDPATLERAMEPFFTTKPPGRGTGLGLSTCYGIITGLGGRMHLDSKPGAGTAVAFELPAWAPGEEE